MKTTWKIVDELASRQWSLVTREQLLAGEISRDEVASLLRMGALQRRRHRVYATAGAPRSWEQSLLARVLAAGAGAVASHGAGGRLWGWVHRAERELDVSILVDRLTSASRRTQGVHRTLILPSSDVTERYGIPCTSFERTLCDCTTLLTEYQLGRVLDDGLRRGVHRSTSS